MPHRPGHRNINRATTSRVPNRNRQRITNSTIVDGNDRPVINRTTTGTSVSFNGPGGGVNSRTTAPRNVGMRTVNQPQPNNSVRLFRAEADNMYRKPDGTFVMRGEALHEHTDTGVIMTQHSMDGTGSDASVQVTRVTTSTRRGGVAGVNQTPARTQSPRSGNMGGGRSNY